MQTADATLAVNRWRLILGGFSDRQLGFGGSEREIQAFSEMEQLLDYLYGNAQDDDVRQEDSESRAGGSGPSVLNAAEWITRVRKLFPRSTAEVLERHALEEFNMTELLADKTILEQMKPDFDLLKTILQLKHLMKGEVLETAKRTAKQVADELRKQIENDVRRAVLGRIDRNTSSPVHSARNIDMQKTIRRNLKHYDTEREMLVLQDIYFSSRIKRYNNKRIIIAVDESGSMVSSVIYSAVMAQILANLPFAEVKLVIFDTSVVDLSDQADDPAQILMSVQLGGGTDIGKALAYCETLILNPQSTCVITVTDLYEGADKRRLLQVSNQIIASGSKLSFLTALDAGSEPAFDRRLGQQLANMGAFVGAMTPDRLGDYIGKIFS